MDDDFLLALKLQEQFDNESTFLLTNTIDNNSYDETKKRKVESTQGQIVPSYSCSSFNPERPMSIVDESWENLDPSPDVRAMFMEFNDTFFWGKLCGVEVKWSARMTLCAGVCCYEGRGGLCSIRLSEPLLKLRPRRDLVETLLHEMIHALLFVTQNNRDRDGHGPEFCKHMNRINSATGTKISIYHSFHDEVDQYRQHWWRCTGSCQTKKPFFGYVKRSMNRAPSANDTWWAEHQRTCGGKYVKIKEPENYKKKGKKGETDDKKQETKIKEAINKKEAPKTLDSGKTSHDTGKTNGVDIQTVIPFSGKGFVLGKSSQGSSPQKSSSVGKLSENSNLFGSQGSPVDRPKASGNGKLEWPEQLHSSQTNSTASAFPNSGCLAGNTNLPSRQPQSSGKRSVGNSKAFRNVNGSPVRILPLNGQLKNQNDFAGVKQRTVYDVFNSKSFKPPEKAGVSASTTNFPKPENRSAEAKQRSIVDALYSQSFKSAEKSGASGTAMEHKKPENQPPDQSLGLKQKSSFEGFNSKYFKSAEKAVADGSGVNPKKRLREENNTAPILNFFQKSKKELEKPTTTNAHSSNTVANILPAAARPNPDPLSSPSITVSCPVCQVSILESKINEHLDSCLM